MINARSQGEMNEWSKAEKTGILRLFPARDGKSLAHTQNISLLGERLIVDVLNLYEFWIQPWVSVGPLSGHHEIQYFSTAHNNVKRQKSHFQTKSYIQNILGHKVCSPRVHVACPQHHRHACYVNSSWLHHGPPTWALVAVVLGFVPWPGRWGLPALRDGVNAEITFCGYSLYNEK